MIKTTNLRLDPDKPDHRKAYDILKSSDMSYSNTVVAALISFSENEENRKTLFDGIRKFVERRSAQFVRIRILNRKLFLLKLQIPKILPIKKSRKMMI